MASDRPFLDGLFLSSTARVYLDNLRPSRARSGLLPRTVCRHELEEQLDNLIRRAGLEAVHRLRDEALSLAALLDRTAEARKLDALIGALAGTREAKLASAAARARRRGKPYDRPRLALFEILHRALRREPPGLQQAGERDVEQAATLAFYDAYFSNFIEGTEFAVGEAADIVLRSRIPAHRPDDAHDIVGVWRLVSDVNEMRLVPKDAAECIVILRRRHASVLRQRPDALPGQFKPASNQAGATVFVLPEDVVGTLERGFDLCRSLETAFQRAVFMLFLVTEVHPFVDGNGRIARITMNAELVSRGEQSIVIPTVYRGNYFAAQRALTHNRVAEPLIRMLDYAQRWSAAMDWRSVQTTLRELDSCNAFLYSETAEQEGRRLRMPEGVP